MHDSHQRWLVLLGSLSLSTLLLGGFAGGWAVWRGMHEQLQDPEFLRRQLERADPQAGQRTAKPRRR